MKKKKLIIAGIIIAVLAIIGISGYYVGKYYLVNYTFNKYVISTALDMIKKEPAEGKKNDGEAKQTESKQAQSGETNTESSAAAPENTGGTVATDTKAKKPVSELTNSEVASIVSRTPSLMSKLEGIVSYDDKQHVINILMSNFTQQEIAEYSKKAAGGLTSEEKSQLMSIARSRITSAQWSECMQLFYKYVDQLKPYIE